MIIFNPVHAVSSTSSFLDGNEFAVSYPLMETPAHKMLYRAFPNHNVYRNLMKFQLDNDFNVGTWVISRFKSSSIFSVGVGDIFPDADVKLSVKQLNLQLSMLPSGQRTVIPQELLDMPGMDLLKKEISNHIELEVGTLKEIYSWSKKARSENV